MLYAGRAIERASWGKSKCECKCLFPNTGGLHRTYGDAPLEILETLLSASQFIILCVSGIIARGNIVLGNILSPDDILSPDNILSYL
jgi:hypothetical protein